MKKIFIVGLLMLLMSSMVFAQPIVTQYRVGANDDFVEVVGMQTMTTAQAQERVQLIEQLRIQLQLNCDNCTYEINEVDPNETIVMQERNGKFLGMSVVMRERYAINEEGNVEKKNQNFFAFLERFGLAREV